MQQSLLIFRRTHAFRDIVVGFWEQLSLTKKFAAVGSLVLLLAMLSIGIWVQEKIRAGVVQNSAAAMALYIDSFLSVHLQELENSDRLSPESRANIDKLVMDTALGKEVATLKIWKQGGYIAYSSRKDLIGKSFEPTDNLKNAWRGRVSAEFESLDDPEDATERATGLTLLEMYIPVRKTGEDKIVAVVEFYTTGDKLRAELNRASLDSWLVVGLVTLIMFGALSGIVLQGSRTIEAQRGSLVKQIGQLRLLLEQNTALRQRVQRAYRRTGELNERFLRNIGAELHDGPAQLVGLALLRLDGLKPEPNARHGEGASAKLRNFEIVRSALADSLVEIRNLSAGLAAPDLKQSDLNNALHLAIRSHETRTESRVAAQLQYYAGELPEEAILVIYRFVQEGLNNAFRHAGGIRQAVKFAVRGDTIRVEVSDGGPGMKNASAKGTHGIGLIALRDRVESLGGTFDIKPVETGGTRLVMTISLSSWEHLNGK